MKHHLLKQTARLLLVLPVAGLLVSTPREVMATTACQEGTHFTLTRLNGGIEVVYRFTQPCSWTVPNGVTRVRYLVVGGGGGGGAHVGGGGGGGGVRTGTMTGMTPGSSMNVVIGAGGTGGTGGGAHSCDVAGRRSTNGGDSTFGSITAAGGGGGGSWDYCRGLDGGTGGGGGTTNNAGSGNTPATSPAQGASGGVGSGFIGNNYVGGGGGGAGTAGRAGSTNTGGDGGAGVQSDISGSSTYYGGGGGGGVHSALTGSVAGAGGAGGGGAGNINSGTTAQSGAANTGGGGGGAGRSSTSASRGGDGGSGIVIVRARVPMLTTTVSGIPQVVEGFTVDSGLSSWTVPKGVTSIDYLVVGGGGGGGSHVGGGGGGGGVLTGTIAVTEGSTATITVGAGGLGGAVLAACTNPPPTAAGSCDTLSRRAANGTSSTLAVGGNTITALGGGGGGHWSYFAGRDGASGGGSGRLSTTRGSGTTGQGFRGGSGSDTASLLGGGGGGAGQVGGDATSSTTGKGGDGVVSSITGTATYFGGGGSGANHGGSATIAAGGRGGGGDGAAANQRRRADDGLSGTGGGGGGGGVTNSVAGGEGGNGGSGIVIVRYSLPITEPDLLDEDDSGSASDDNRTNKTTLRFSGSALPGSTVQLSTAAAGTSPSGGSWTNTGSSCAASSEGEWTCTTADLEDGSYSVRATTTVTIDGTSVSRNSATAMALTVDTTAPSVTSFSSATPNGSYRAGQSVNVTATVNEAVQSGNTLTVTLDTGATVTLTAASAGTSLSGSYTIAAGQTSADLTVSSFVVGTVDDVAGNAMTSTTVPSGTSNIAGSKEIVVDGIAPSASLTGPSSPSQSRSLSYSLSFDESVSGLATADFEVVTVPVSSSCSVSGLSGSSGSSFTVTVTCSADRDVVLRLKAGSVSDEAGNAGPESAVSASSVTVAATLTVTLDLGGGAFDPVKTEVTTLVGGSVASSPGTPVLAGYTFSGWSAADGGSVLSFPWTHGRTGDFSLFAVWEADALRVSFNSRGGTLVPDEVDFTVTGGSIAEDDLPAAPSRSGFGFLGWAESADDAAAGIVIDFDPSWSHGKTGDFSLYAAWSALPIVVTYDLQGGSAAFGTSVSTEVGSSLTSPGTPTRPGFTFGGWSTVQPTASSGWPVAFAPWSSTWTHNRRASFTLYALWRETSSPRNVWFYPGAEPSDVMTVLAPDSMTPAFPRSVDSYTVTATIATPAGIGQLDTVTMCWYKTGIGSGTCDDAETDPETEFKVVWEEVSGEFTKSGTNNYEVQNSTYSSTETTVTVNFVFKISNAMRQGGWTVVVTALDDSGATRTKTDTATVDPFVEILLPRAQQDFGTLAEGASATITDIPIGRYSANDNADFTISASNFNAGSRNVNIKEDDGNPAAGEVTLDCNIGPTLSSPRRITRSNAAMSANLDPTGEARNTNTRMSCRLTYGRGAPLALLEYSNTVTFTIARRS